MLAHRSGQNWDRRTLEDLHYSVLRVSCRSCRHSNLIYPVDILRHPRIQNTAWTLLIPRFRCSVCLERDAVAECHPLPRWARCSWTTMERKAAHCAAPYFELA